MKRRNEIILWDAASLFGALLYIFWNVSENNHLIVGILTLMIFSFTIQKHIAAYKIDGTIY